MNRPTRCVGAVVFVGALAAQAWGQEDRTDEGLPVALSLATLPGDADEDAGPDLTAEELQEQAEKPEESRIGFGIGPRVGFLRGRDAEKGTWLVGLQVRLKLGSRIQIEGSVEFHEEEFSHGDVEVTTIPVQLTAILTPFPRLPLEPYLLGGVGWYFQDFHFQDNLSSLNDEEDGVFGVHVGLGVHLFGLINVDLRYILLDESDEFDGFQFSGSTLDDDNFDYWQLTAALNIFF